MLKLNRREALARLGGLIGLGLVGGRGIAQTSATQATESAGATGGSFSIAHITDVHITDSLNSPEWFARCLQQIHAEPSKPAFILNTGDSVMDSLKAPRERADQLWALWRKVVDSECKLKMHSCLGNHDHWGLALNDQDAVKNDPMYGKALGLKNLGLDRGYYSFDHGGWHFIALDSIQPTGKPADHSGWTGILTDEQFAWLEKDLAATPADRPVLVFSHMPIIEVCVLIRMKPNKEDNYNLAPYSMHGDANRILNLFRKHRNVKVALSGHIHMNDKIELEGVTYICDGSVCGAWWRGNLEDSPPGYSMLTLHPDGKFDYDYKTYGWKEGVAPA